MSHFHGRVLLIKAIGSLFYLLCMFQWLWSLLPFIPGILKLVEPKDVSQPVVIVPVDSISTGPPSVWLIIFAATLVVGFIGLSIYLFIKIPSLTYKTSQKVVVGTAKRLTPIVKRGVKISPKKRWQLTERIIFYIRLAICVLPVVLAMASYYVDTVVSFELTVFVAAAMAITSSVLLGLLVVLPGWLKADSGDLGAKA